MLHSNITHVHLVSLATASTGRYRCEVSSEAPVFATDSKFGDLLVVVVPQLGPQIQGAHERYSRGDRVEMNCTVAATMPPANISWYINQRLVRGRQLEHHPVLNWTSPREGVLHTASLGLTHTLTRWAGRSNSPPYPQARLQTQQRSEVQVCCCDL